MNARQPDHKPSPAAAHRPGEPTRWLDRLGAAHASMRRGNGPLHASAPADRRIGSPAPVVGGRAACSCGGACPRCQAARPTTVAAGDVATRERGADARAIELLRAADPSAESAAPALALAAEPGLQPPAALAAVMASPGRPLAEGPGLGFAARFGAEAARIRVHDDDAAAQATHAFGADAFAFGRHLAFGEGRYRPGTGSGDALIAHEIAHLEQQASAGRPALDLSPTAQPLGAAYQPMLDRIAKDEADKSQTWGIGGWHLPVLYKMQELAEAAEAKDSPRTQAAVTDFLAAARKAPLDPATSSLLEGVPMTLVSRVYLIGLAAESKRLQDYFFGKEGQMAYDQPSREKGYATDYAVWKRIVDDAIAAGANDDAVQAGASIDLLLLALKGVNDAAGALDPKQVEKDLEDAAKESMYAPSIGLWPHNPDQNAGGHYSHLLRLVPMLMAALQQSFQVLLDAAVSQFQAGQGSAALGTARTTLQTKLYPALNVPRLLGIKVAITRSDFAGKKKRHLDAFDMSKKAPEAEIQAYAKDESFFFEKELSVGRIYEIRAEQIATLERLFGLEKDKTNTVTAESAENAAAIKATADFKLHDDDSWRAFSLQKFRASQKRLGDDWQALKATIDILRDYLAAFTIHSPYNIDEFGDNYLGRTFPRALTGQFIEDCGVYALKIAYALSLVRKDLGLNFRVVVLPVHVSLVISFDDVAKGAFFVNNNQFTPVDAATIKTFSDTWTKTDEKGKPLATPQPLDTNKFLGELAAATFVERTDMPYRVEQVPDVPDVKDAAKRHAVLWTFYHDKVLKPVTAPTADSPQPELKFLSLLEHEKQLYNELVVPFWRVANARFTAQRDALTAAAADLGSPDPKKKAAALATLAAHKKELLDMAKPLRGRIAQLAGERAEVTQFIQAHPEAAAKTAGIAPWVRMLVTFSWEIQLDAYLGDDQRAGDLLDGKVLPAPWGDTAQLLHPID